MFNPSREQVRSFFCEAWRKRCAREVVTGAEAVAADLIEQHPEYHALLGQPESALEQEFTPELERLAVEIAKHLKTEADLTALSRQLLKLTVESALKAELDTHLGYERRAAEGRGSGNAAMCIRARRSKGS